MAAEKFSLTLAQERLDPAFTIQREANDKLESDPDYLFELKVTPAHME